MSEEYILHSKGENWYHFRKNIGSLIESFSVTYCHDGTVCMTGDYGCLCWQRQFFPKHLEYGFPNEMTYINYFAEKVVRAEEAQTIKTWKKDLAIDQIKETIKEYQHENDTEGIELLEVILERIEYIEDRDTYGYIQMLELFSDQNHIESEYYYDYGRCYTDLFKMQFAMIQSVSDIIIHDVTECKDEASTAKNK